MAIKKISPSEAILKEILGRCRRFEKLLNAAKKRPSPDVIHYLRVAIRRFYAAADFYGAARGMTKSLMDILGRLRDLHVRIELIKRFASADTILLNRFQKKTASRAVRKEKAAISAVKSYRTDSLDNFKRNVAEELKNRGSEEEIMPGFIMFLVLRRVKDVERRRLRYLKGGKMESFHKMRIAVKELRYFCELVLPALRGLTRRDVERIHLFQTEMGNIHDIYILGKHFARYVEKKNCPDSASLKQLKEILRKKEAMLTRFNKKARKLRLLKI